MFRVENILNLKTAFYLLWLVRQFLTIGCISLWGLFTSKFIIFIDKSKWENPISQLIAIYDYNYKLLLATNSWVPGLTFFNIVLENKFTVLFSGWNNFFVYWLLTLLNSRLVKLYQNFQRQSKNVFSDSPWSWRFYFKIWEYWMLTKFVKSV